MIQSRDRFMMSLVFHRLHQAGGIIEPEAGLFRQRIRPLNAKFQDFSSATFIYKRSLTISPKPTPPPHTEILMMFIWKHYQACNQVSLPKTSILPTWE
jgi:hypothetical protein